MIEIQIFALICYVFELHFSLVRVLSDENDVSEITGARTHTKRNGVSVPVQFIIQILILPHTTVEMSFKV